MGIGMLVKRATTVFLAVSLVLTFSAAASAAPASKANGTVDPYNLSLTALKGQEQTDLYISVSPKEAGFTAPDSLKKVQLKSFSTDGEHEYTHNSFDIASPTGEAVISLSDVDRYQVLETKVAVKNAQTVSEKNLSGKVTVLLRPDLSFEEVTAPEQTKVNVPFTVNAVLKESNLDVGASAKVTILNGDQVLDVANGVVVEKGGSKSVAFALQLSEVGDYNLRAVISDVVPTDYNNANNEASFPVQVIDSLQSVTYSSSYNYEEDYDYHYQEFDWNGNLSRDYHAANTYENFSLYATTSDVFDPAGEFKINLTDEDGNTQAITLTGLQYQHWSQYYGYNAYYGYDATSNLNVYVYQYPWGTDIHVHKSAGNYQYSENYYGYYYTDSGSYGAILGAKQELSVHFELPTTTGSAYGGSYEIPLAYYPSTWENYYNNYWYYYSYKYWGSSNLYSGYSSGVTTTQ